MSMSMALVSTKYDKPSKETCCGILLANYKRFFRFFIWEKRLIRFSRRFQSSLHKPTVECLGWPSNEEFVGNIFFKVFSVCGRHITFKIDAFLIKLFLGKKICLTWHWWHFSLEILKNFLKTLRFHYFFILGPIYFLFKLLGCVQITKFLFEENVEKMKNFQKLLWD